MEEAITCSSLQVTSKGTNHRVLVCLSCVIQLVLHQLVWSNALCCFHLGQQRLCPPGFRRATSAQNPPATISAPCWGFGQAIPSGMPRHCAHPNLPISCSFQPPSKLGVAGKDGTRNFPAFSDSRTSYSELSPGPPRETLSVAVKRTQAGRGARTVKDCSAAGWGRERQHAALLRTSLYRHRQLYWKRKTSPSPQNGAHVPGCLLPREHRAKCRRRGEGAGAAQAHRPPPPRGTPGVVVRAGTCRGGRSAAGEPCPAAGPVPSRAWVCTLTLGPVPSEHWPTLSSLPRPRTAQRLPERLRFSVSPKVLSVNFRKSGHLRSSSPHSYTSSLLFRFAHHLRCWKWQLMNTCPYSTLACHLPQPLRKPTRFLLLSALCLTAVPSFISCPGRLTSQFCTSATDHFGDCSLGATCSIGLLQDLRLCCKGG